MKYGGKVFRCLIDKALEHKNCIHSFSLTYCQFVRALNIVNLPISQHEMLHRLAHQLNMDYINATEQMPDIQ